MRIKNSQESHYLSTKLLRMLEQLNFSVIRARCLLDDSYLGTNEKMTFAIDYSPWILATKHDVEYLFEYVKDHGDVMALKNLLQSQINKWRGSWEKSLVLVTGYGNGERIRQSARDLALPYDNIWEI